MDKIEKGSLQQLRPGITERLFEDRIDALEITVRASDTDHVHGKLENVVQGTFGPLTFLNLFFKVSGFGFQASA